MLSSSIAAHEILPNLVAQLFAAVSSDLAAVWKALTPEQKAAHGSAAAASGAAAAQQ